MNTKEKCGFQEGVLVPDPDTADIEYHVEGLYEGRQVEEYLSKTDSRGSRKDLSEAR